MNKYSNYTNILGLGQQRQMPSGLYTQEKTKYYQNGSHDPVSTIWHYGVKRHFQQYFSYIVAVSFIGGGNRSTRRKPPTCRKSLTNLSHNVTLLNSNVHEIAPPISAIELYH
jgi:hypothetical protein